MVAAALFPASPTTVVDQELIQAVRSGTLTEAQALAFAKQSPELIAFTLLALAQQAGQSSAAGPHTPSGVIPPYQKPNSSARKKKRGAQPGHPGTCRKPAVVRHRLEHQAPCCPDCGGALRRTGKMRSRVTEDIPASLKPEVAEHTIHRDWCPKCRKRVEPRLPEVLPHCQLGNRAVFFSATLHYSQGCTLQQIVEVFQYHLHFSLTAGGLVQMWQRLADVLYPWYEEINDNCLNEAVLHADETGWRVEGRTHWLWCFAGQNSTYYKIDRSRGHPALERFFVEEFEGVLVCDFFAAYDAVSCLAFQRCWPHLLREVHEIGTRVSAVEWDSFARRLKRLYADGVRLKMHRPDYTESAYEAATTRLEERVLELAAEPWTQADAVRLAKRLRRYADQLFTFVREEHIPPDNNHAERSIRPAVLIRKNSYANQSEKGALTQAVLMSILRTLKQRGLDPLETLQAALRTLATTGSLPPLPAKFAPQG